MYNNIVKMYIIWEEYLGRKPTLHPVKQLGNIEVFLENHMSVKVYFLVCHCMPEIHRVIHTL